MSALPGLSNVATGLRIMYYGLLLIVLAVLAQSILPAAAPQLVIQIGFVRFIETCAYLQLAGFVLHLVGQLFCLAIPGQTGAAPAMYLSLLLSVVVVAVQLLTIFSPTTLLQILPVGMLQSLGYIELGLFTLAICLLLLSLKALNRYIGSERNATRANTTFFATLILIGLFVALTLAVMQAVENIAAAGPLNRRRGENDLLLGLSIGTLVFGLVWLVLYGNTLTYTARALTDYDRRGGRPVDA